jgi:hypothetical protein
MRGRPVPNERELDELFLLRKSCPSSASKPQRAQRISRRDVKLFPLRSFANTIASFAFNVLNAAISAYDIADPRSSNYTGAQIT